MDKLNFQIVVENLKKFMELRKKTLNTLSKETDIPYSTLQSILNGDTKDMKLSNAEKICKNLGITLDELMYSEEQLQQRKNISLDKIQFANISTNHIDLDGLTIDDIDELQRIANYLKNKK